MHHFLHVIDFSKEEDQGFFFPSPVAMVNCVICVQLMKAFSWWWWCTSLTQGNLDSELVDLPVNTGSDIENSELDNRDFRFWLNVCRLFFWFVCLLVVIYKNSLSDQRWNQQVFLDRVTPSAGVEGQWTHLLVYKIQSHPGGSQGWCPFLLIHFQEVPVGSS